MKSSYSLKIHPAVEKDLLQAYSWYQQKMIGLGDEFLGYFYSSAKVILENPFRYSKVYKNYRRYLFHKFPYAIYYIINEKLIIIMGVFHHARDPNKIRSALRYRKR